MKYRTLGSSGIRVSEIGFGGWGIGGATEGATSYGPTDRTDSILALEEAFERGVNYFDTAGVYGESEQIIGRIFRNRRGQVIIGTKVGFLEHHTPQDFSKNNIVATLEKSLANMATDYIDLYQLHNPNLSVLPMDEIIDTLMGLKKRGLVRALGISVKSPSDGLKALGYHQFDSTQTNLSMVDQRAVDNGLLALADKLGVGIIGRTPLNFGFLTDNGKTMSLDFSPQDHRSTWHKAQLRSWQRASRLFAEINPYKNSSLSQFALRFCLDTKGVSIVIPGMLTVSDVQDNLTATDLKPLDQTVMGMIRQIYEDNNEFFVKRLN